MLSVLPTIQEIAAILLTFDALAIGLKYTSSPQEAQDVCRDGLEMSGRFVKTNYTADLYEKATIPIRDTSSRNN